MKNELVLTKTEDSVVRYVCHGFQNKEIADKMNRSEETIKIHLRHIHQKINENNKVEIVIWYLENRFNINIKKMVQIGILLLILAPSILMDDNSLVRVQRTTRTTRSIRSRRGEESDYYLPLV